MKMYFIYVTCKIFLATFGTLFCVNNYPLSGICSVCGAEENSPITIGDCLGMWFGNGDGFGGAYFIDKYYAIYTDDVEGMDHLKRLDEIDIDELIEHYTRSDRSYSDEVKEIQKKYGYPTKKYPSWADGYWMYNYGEATYLHIENGKVSQTDWSLNWGEYSDINYVVTGAYGILEGFKVNFKEMTLEGCCPLKESTQFIHRQD